MFSGGIKYFRKSLKAITEASKWISTTVLTLIIVVKPYISHGVHLVMTAFCFAITTGACALGALHLKYKDSKAIEKAYKASLKLGRFLKVNMMFFGAMKGLTRDVLSMDEYMALAVSLGFSIPLALWRAYDSSKGKHCVVNSAVPERNTMKRQCINWGIVKRTASRAAEASGTASLAMWTANTLFVWRNVYLNFGVSSLFFVVGAFAGYKIEKEDSLPHEKDSDYVLSNVTEDRESQVGQACVRKVQQEGHANFMTISARGFTRSIEFSEDGLITFMGLMFTYASLLDTDVVDDRYGMACVAVAFVAAMNSDRKTQPKMLTGNIDREEILLGPSQHGTVVVEEVKDDAFPPAASPIPIPKNLVGDEQRIIPNDSPEGSPASSDGSSAASDSPPQSGSLPANLVTPVTTVAMRAQSLAGEEMRAEVRAQKAHHYKQGWGEWIRHTFWGGSSANSRELAQALLHPADRTDAQLVGAKV